MARYYNSEHYPDPTVYEVERRIEREKKRKRAYLGEKKRTEKEVEKKWQKENMNAG